MDWQMDRHSITQMNIEYNDSCNPDFWILHRDEDRVGFWMRVFSVSIQY